jgi:hypothetical protein
MTRPARERSSTTWRDPRGISPQASVVSPQEIKLQQGPIHFGPFDLEITNMKERLQFAVLQFTTQAAETLANVKASVLAQ